MREMVLNHASCQAPNRDIAVSWLKELAAGMAQLRQEQVVAPVLRQSKNWHEIACLANWSLFNAHVALRQTGARDEYLFLTRLTTKIPLDSDLDKDDKDRFLGCDAKTLPREDGIPLILCAHQDWIAISFPSKTDWDRDCLSVRFQELLLDASDISEEREYIDNLARSSHARTIGDRHRVEIRQVTTFEGLWTDRGVAFPHLLFGPDLPQHLAILDVSFLRIVVKRLASLDATAAEWRDHGGSQPRWKCRVTPESQSVRNNSVLIGHRFFKSQSGESKLFEWHARFGSSRRIHLRFDPSSHEIEIGYIGRHLPL